MMVLWRRGDSELTADPNAVTFIMDACRHLKAIATAGIPRLAQKAGLVGKAGVVELTLVKGIPRFLSQPKWASLESGLVRVRLILTFVSYSDIPSSAAWQSNCCTTANEMSSV